MKEGLAPGMAPSWSGQNWYYTSAHSAYTRSIYVIDSPTESYGDYHERKKKEEAGAKKVPFGFSDRSGRKPTKRKVNRKARHVR